MERKKKNRESHLSGYSYLWWHIKILQSLCTGKEINISVVKSYKRRIQASTMLEILVFTRLPSLWVSCIWVAPWKHQTRGSFLAGIHWSSGFTGVCESISWNGRRSPEFIFEIAWDRQHYPFMLLLWFRKLWLTENFSLCICALAAGSLMNAWQ